MSEIPNQSPFTGTAIELITNPSRRCPVVLLVDTSGSMGGKPIDSLNQGVTEFLRDLCNDSLASKRVELSIISFDSEITPVVNFTNPDQIYFEPLKTQGVTAMGAGLTTAMEHLEARKLQYRENGIDYYRPWILLITDGAPTDEWQTVAAEVVRQEKAGKFTLFAVGVENAQFDILNQISQCRPALKLKELEFGELFTWLSKSVKAVSASRPGDKVVLEEPTWVQIDV